MKTENEKTIFEQADEILLENLENAADWKYKDMGVHRPTNYNVVNLGKASSAIRFLKVEMKGVLSKIESLLDDEFQTKDELVPDNIVEIYELLAKFK